MANYGDWTAFSWNAPSVFSRNMAANNIPHMFQLGYVYEVPFGSGKKWATNGVSKAVLGDCSSTAASAPTRDASIRLALPGLR